MHAAAPYADPWRFVSNVEVYLLVAFLVGAYVYMVRVIGPKAVAPGEQVISRRNLWSFIAAMLLLFVGSTWPLHQIAEGYLYSAHMLQHMMLSYFMPPLVLLATPEWLLRVLVGDGRTYRVVRFFSTPVVAAVLFNAMVMVSHIPGVVNASTTNGPLHYFMHFAIVSTALLMWMPVVGPFKELHMKPVGKMIYLFLQSVVPTVPAAWLALAEGTVYDHYGDEPVRVWGINPIDDQQIAGLIMKVGGGIFLWTVVITMFVKRFGKSPDTENSYRRRAVAATEEPLTYEQVTEAFDRAEAPSEPRR
ncbi:MAG: cytochrome c oxidase assembly protein [Actinomycetota bacterium]|nr:cytochrome c oxidase assembly protein [Actinomycetota bacterium]